MARPAFLLALLALGSWVQAQDFPLISMEVKGERLERALPRIAQGLGQRLSFSPEFANEVLVIRWKDLPGQRALDSLARNLGAEWVETAEGKRLTRTPAVRAALEQQERPDLLKALAESISDIGKPPAWMRNVSGNDLPDMPPGDEEEQTATAKEVRALFEELEKARTELSRVLRQVLNPELLVNIRLEERTVFSTQPTSGQAPFLLEAKAAFAEFQRKQRSLRDRMRKVMDVEEGESDEAIGITPVTRILMIVERANPMRWSIRTHYLSANNMPTNQESHEVRAFSSDAEAIMFTGEEAASKVELPYKLNSPKREIPIQESMKPLSIMMNAITQGAPPPVMQGDVFAFFRTPDVSEPLSLTASGYALALAEDQNANLTAVIPDEWFALESATFMNRALNLEGASRMVEGLGLTRTENKDGLLEIRPKFLLSATRLDRVAVRRAIDQEAAQGGLSLDQKAALMETYPDRSESLFMIYQFISLTSLMDGFFFGGMGGLGGDNNMEVLRFYHVLSPEQKRGLMAGQPLNFRELTPEQRRRFMLCINDVTDVTAPQRDWEDMFLAPTAEPAMTEEMMQRTMNGRPFADLSDRPTALPTGGFVRAKVKRETVVKPAVSSNTIFPGQIMSASTYAFMQQMMTRPEAQAFAAMMPKLDRLRVGERTTLQLEFHVFDGFGARGAASGVRFTGDPSGVPESSLPEDFLARLRQVREALERSESEGQPNGNTPPPPPHGSTP